MDDSHAKLHLGYQYGFVGNPKGFARDAVAEYRDMGGEKDMHTPYLHGLWIVHKEDIEYAGELGEGYIALRFSGKTCELVGDKESFEIQTREGVAYIVPQKRGAQLREIIFLD